MKSKNPRSQQRKASEQKQEPQHKPKQKRRKTPRKVEENLYKPQSYDKGKIKQIFLFSAIILALAFLVYSRAATYTLVHCDDNIFVLDYKDFNYELSNITKTFNQTLGTTYYRPLLASSFVIDANIGKQLAQANQNKEEESVFINAIGFVYNSILNISFLLHNPEFTKAAGNTLDGFANNLITGSTDPRVFHVTNLLIHLFSSLLVFLFLIRLDYPVFTSFFFSLLFTVHPVLTPAASWISGRNDSLITFFVLISFMFLISFLNLQKRRYDNKDYVKLGVYFIFHLFFFAGALFTKEIGGVLPVVAFAYILLYRKEKLFAPKNFILVAGWSLVVIIWYAMRYEATKGLNNPDTIGLDAFVKNYPTIAALLGKIILPIKMIALSNYEWFSITCGIIVILLALVAFVYLRGFDKSKALFGVTWFVIFLFPTLMVRIIYVDDFFDYAEHRAYLVMVGIIIIIAEILQKYKVDFRKPIPIAIGAVLLVFFTIKSYTYIPTFKDRFAFWGHMTEMYPWKSRGYYDLGKAYLVHGQLDTAEKLYMKGLERNPDNKNLYIDLASLYYQKPDFDKLYKSSQKALQIDPADPLANYFYAQALLQGEDKAKSLDYFERAAFSTNKYYNIAIEYGIACQRLGQYERSIRGFDLYLQHYPNDPKAIGYLGNSYAMLSQFDKAVDYWNRSIAIDPKFYEPYNHLVRYYLQSNQKQLARQVYQALRQNGGDLNDGLKQLYNAAF